MRGKLVQIIILIFLFMLGTAVTQAKAEMITVDNGGKGNYASIQEAVNNAHSGDTILVSPGVYRENIEVNKELTILSNASLSGSETNRTYIISAVPDDAVLSISSGNVTITGFHISGGSSENNLYGKAGLYLESVRNCSLSNNTLILTGQGIFLNNSQGNYLKGNVVSLGNEGITLDNSVENMLSNNLVIKNNQGILLNNSVNNTIVNNTAGSNEIGVILQISRGNKLAYNLILKNEYGIQGQLVESNIFNSNRLYLNRIGVYIRDSSNNSFYENEFINFVNAIDEGNNVWNSSSAGNFWDNHTGEDADKNGIIDTQYIINQTSGALDHMPLVNRIYPGSSYEILNANGNTVLTRFNKKNAEDSSSAREEGVVVETTELAQINTSLEKGPVLLRLGAEWCHICQSLKPTLDELAAEYGDKATVMSIDINRNVQLATYFEVGHIPDSSVIVGIENEEYVYMKLDGNVTTDRARARIVGLEDKEVFERLLENALAYEEKGKP